MHPSQHKIGKHQFTIIKRNITLPQKCSSSWGLRRAIKTTSSNIIVTDAMHTIIISRGSGITLTLPASSSCTGSIYVMGN